MVVDSLLRCAAYNSNGILVMPDAPRVPAKPRPPTRDDVARYAGVSTAVVSYVINDGPRRVAPEKRLPECEPQSKVPKYRPATLNARALKKGSTEMLGLVLPDITNPFFAEYTRVFWRCRRSCPRIRTRRGHLRWKGGSRTPYRERPCKPTCGWLHHRHRLATLRFPCRCAPWVVLQS